MQFVEMGVNTRIGMTTFSKNNFRLSKTTLTNHDEHLQLAIALIRPVFV